MYLTPVALTVPAHDVRVGDWLESSGNTRVVLLGPTTDKVRVQARTTTSLKPSVYTWEPTEPVEVWRLQSPEA